MPVKDFKLERIGSVIRGNLVFEMPAEELRSLDLRFYDYAHGHMAVPIARGRAPRGIPKPLAAPLKNEVLEVAAYGVTKSPEVNGAKAPRG